MRQDAESRNAIGAVHGFEPSEDGGARILCAANAPANEFRGALRGLSQLREAAQAKLDAISCRSDTHHSALGKQQRLVGELLRAERQLGRFVEWLGAGA